MGAKPNSHLSTRHSLHIRKFFLLDAGSSRTLPTVLRNPPLKSALGVFQCMRFRHTFQQQTKPEFWVEWKAPQESHLIRRLK